MQINLGIVDQNTLVREGVLAITLPEKNLEVVFSGEKPENVKRLLNKPAQPHVLIIDTSIKNHQRDKLIEVALKKDIKCILVNLPLTAPVIADAHNSSASGLVARTADSNELLDAIRTVHQNGTYVSKDIRKKLDSALNENPFLQLSNREADICRHIIDGVKIKRIANLLDISPKTVYVHKANAYRKLRINSTQSLFSLARKVGFGGF